MKVLLVLLLIFNSLPLSAQPLADNRQMNNYFDNYGLIVQANGDAGDSASRVGLYYSYLKLQGAITDAQNLSLTQGFSQALKNLTTSQGFIRHPYFMGAEKYVYLTNEFSRDQQTPLVIAMGLLGFKDQLVKTYKTQLSHLGLYQNLDISSPEDLFSVYLRALKDAGVKHLSWFYPLILTGDWFLVANSVIRVIKSYWNADDTSDDINHILILIQSQRTLPTPLSWLAKQIYVNFRKNSGSTLTSRLGGFGPLTAYEWYFRAETNAPPLAQVARKVILKELANFEEDDIVALAPFEKAP